MLSRIWKVLSNLNWKVYRLNWISLHILCGLHSRLLKTKYKINRNSIFKWEIAQTQVEAAWAISDILAKAQDHSWLEPMRLPTKTSNQDQSCQFVYPTASSPRQEVTLIWNGIWTNTLWSLPQTTIFSEVHILCLHISKISSVLPFSSPDFHLLSEKS